MNTYGEFHSQVEKKPKYTGKRLVMLDSKATQKTIINRAQKASLRLASFSDYKKEDQEYVKAFEEADGIVFERFGVAVINENKESQVSMLTASTRTKSTFIYSEPERFVYALPDSYVEFIKGYKSAVDDIYNRLILKGTSSVKEVDFNDDDEASWGIQAINALQSRYTGKGVNIAILDTGFNLKHPDFNGRMITSKSFIKNQKVDDRNGHGSHCTGLSTGNINQTSGKRYGVAKDSNIFIGKVLSNAGSGTDSGILAGMEWAITNNCKVISMSLGAAVEPGEPYSNIYNDLAKKAMANGALIIAAAGNESRRDTGIIAPVGHPANCPAIMAVAALDHFMNVAYFSCGGFNEDGGQVDVAAPGVDIYSSWKSPDNYETISGTSMATPYVAGIAGLYFEAKPNATPCDIWMSLTQNAKRLNLNSSDVGAGLVQAPK